MTMLRNFRRFFLLGIVALALLLTGCGSGYVTTRTYVTYPYYTNYMDRVYVVHVVPEYTLFPIVYPSYYNPARSSYGAFRSLDYRTTTTFVARNNASSVNTARPVSGTSGSSTNNVARPASPAGNSSTNTAKPVSPTSGGTSNTAKPVSPPTNNTSKPTGTGATAGSTRFKR